MLPLHFLIQFEVGGCFICRNIGNIAFEGGFLEGKEAKKENYDTLC